MMETGSVRRLVMVQLSQGAVAAIEPPCVTPWHHTHAGARIAWSTGLCQPKHWIRRWLQEDMHTP